MTARVLVVGGTGMLGHKLSETLATGEQFEVHCSIRGARMPLGEQASAITYHAGIELSTGTTSLAALLARLAPDVVINAVGAVKQKNLTGALDETLFLNGTLPHALALLNPNSAGKVVHFSTDCVFIGDRGNYSEDETPDAEDLYGRSKACGEIKYGKHLTIRTSIIGFELAGHLGLLSWLFRQAPGVSLPGYTRAIFSGLPTATLSRTVRDVLLTCADLNGLYHVASTPITKFELLQRITARFGLDHELSPDSSVGIDRSLNDSCFRQRTGTATPGWDDLIEELYQDYVSGPYERIYHELRKQTQ